MVLPSRMAYACGKQIGAQLGSEARVPWLVSRIPRLLSMWPLGVAPLGFLTARWSRGVRFLILD